MEYSCFGRKRDQNLEAENGRISAMSIETDDSNGAGKRETDDLTALKILVENVVAYHFCQVPSKFIFTNLKCDNLHGKNCD